MELQIKPEQKKLQQWFYNLTGKLLYFVGGYVRDSLLGYDSQDKDVCAPVSAEEFKKVADKRRAGTFNVIDRAYGLGTVIIIDNESGNYEYTAFRQDNYGRGGTHTPSSVSFTKDIKKDAERRDFTVNALYLSPGAKVIDPLERGIEDLESGIIRRCAKDTLSQDALRILRMVRFAASLGFEIDRETFEAAKQNVSGLKDISKERIKEELEKILLADGFYGKPDAVLRGLYMLKDLGAIKYIIPELMEGEGFKQNPKYHKYDVLNHNLHACASAPPKLELRYAALLHDLGKPRAFIKNGNMYDHPEIGARMAREALKRVTVSKELISYVCKLIENHMFDLDNSAKKNAVLRRASKMGSEAFYDLIKIREADILGSGKPACLDTPDKWRRIMEESKEENAPVKRSDLNVNGYDLIKELNLKPGKEIGILLNELHGYALENPEQNTYQNLIEYAKIVYNRLNALPK